MQEKDLLNALGLRIKKIRVSKKMTQEVLGDIIKCEKSSLSKIESGQVNISYHTLYRLSVGLGVEMRDLVPE